MKMVLTTLAGVLVSLIALTFSARADNHSTEGGMAVIFLCAQDNNRRCSQLTGGTLLLCPVQCGEDANPGDFQSFESSSDITMSGGQYLTPDDRWETGGQVAPQIFDENVLPRPGSVWTPSPAEMFLERGIGNSRRGIGIPK